MHFSFASAADGAAKGNLNENCSGGTSYQTTELILHVSVSGGRASVININANSQLAPCSRGSIPYDSITCVWWSNLLWMPHCTAFISHHNCRQPPVNSCEKSTTCTEMVNKCRYARSIAKNENDTVSSCSSIQVALSNWKWDLSTEYWMRVHEMMLKI